MFKNMLVELKEEKWQVIIHKHEQTCLKAGVNNHKKDDIFSLLESQRHSRTSVIFLPETKSSCIVSELFSLEFSALKNLIIFFFHFISYKIISHAIKTISIVIINKLLWLKTHTIVYMFKQIYRKVFCHSDKILKILIITKIREIKK